ncbi:MAG: ABC transporter permease [Firmicutes bacterium]|nr:ABC transporter permease [Bacillota bacterium]
MSEKEEKVLAIAPTLIAVLLAALLGSLLMMVAGVSPLTGYGALLKGAFGNSRKIADTLMYSSPLIFTGLAVSLAMRAGVFNIGAEGQLYVGGIMAAWVGFSIHGLPGFLHLPLAILAGMLGGGVWGLIPGLLKAKFGAHEVVTTIMMNYISYSLTNYLVVGPWKAPGGTPKTPDVLTTARLGTLVPYSRLNYGLILALLTTLAVYVLLWHTILGYRIRAVGKNPNAARYGGIRIDRIIVAAMGLSGALAALAGIERVLGVYGSFYNAFSPGYGFEGIAVALLGRTHPLGVVAAALLFGALNSGGFQMNLATNIPVDLITILQATIIFMVTADFGLHKLMEHKSLTKRGEPEHV